MRKAIVGAALAACVALSGPAVVGASSSGGAPFDPEAFEAAQQAGKPILVNIVASWCTTCAVQRPIIGALHDQARFKALTIYDVDFDARKDLVRKWRVTAPATMLVFKGRIEEGRMTGETREKAIALLMSRAF